MERKYSSDCKKQLKIWDSYIVNYLWHISVLSFKGIYKKMYKKRLSQKYFPEDKQSQKLAVNLKYCYSVTLFPFFTVQYMEKCVVQEPYYQKIFSIH